MIRRCWLLFVLFLPAASAEIPEALPRYADATALREDASLHAVSFHSEAVGLAVGDRGAIFLTEDGGASWQTQDSGVTCRLEDVHWIDDRNIVVIGGGADRVTGVSRGVTLRSNDGGRRWQRGGDQELPRLHRFTTSPGDGLLLAAGEFSYVTLTQEFESPDGGKTWQADVQSAKRLASQQRQANSTELRAWTERTGVQVAIRGVCRIGKSGLWAVGDHGVILQSTDAGRSWIVRRGQGRRAAVLIVASSISNVAWPIVANESLEMRNRVTVLVDDPRMHRGDLDLLSQATVMLGGSGGDEFSRETNTDQEARNWIAALQPVVVVLDGNLTPATRDTLTDAAIAAGIPRVVSYAFDSRGDNLIHRSALLPRRGMLVSDVWEDALQLVAPQQQSPGSLALSRIYDSVGTRLRGDSVTTGLPIPAGCRLRTANEPASRRQLQIVQARMSQPKQIAALIQQSQTATEFSKTFSTMLEQTSTDDQFRLAWTVLQNVMDRKGLELPIAVAMEEAVLDEFARRFDGTSTGKWASLRRDAMRHSLEWRRLRNSSSNLLASQRNASDQAAKAVPVSPFQVQPNHVGPLGAVRQVSAVSPLQVPVGERIDLTPQVKTTAEVDLSWEFHPLVLIAREAARNRSDDNELQAAGTGSANLNRLAEAYHAGNWARLLRNNSSSVVVANHVPTPPRLDGQLDEPFWTAAKPHAAKAIELRIAYDDQYVYVALRAPADRFGADTSSSHPQKTRDHDLSSVDRLRLRIDTDLDLMTSMQLEVSQAGRTHDAIDGHAAWQPTWYVASNTVGEFVDVEMAILRRDLIDLPIHTDQSWFISTELMSAGQATPWQPLPNADNWLRVVFRS